VIASCDNARERCPMFSDKAKLIHAIFDDPALAIDGQVKAAGKVLSPEEIKRFIQ